jgi:hypothetical protein
MEGSTSLTQKLGDDEAMNAYFGHREQLDR